MQRRNVRVKEAEEKAKKWLSTNEADLAARREAEEAVDRCFDAMTARTLAGWWTKAGSWKMVSTEDS